MKILQVMNYTAPAKGNMGAERMMERLSKGLIQLGHKVYLKANPSSEKMDWIEMVQDIPDCDIIHYQGWMWENEEEYNRSGKPWVATIHGGGMETSPEWLKRANQNPHIICVSKFVADRINCSAYAHTCAEPTEFIFKKDKQNYFLYLASLDWGVQKGLDIFVNLSRKLRNLEFVIAGSGKNVSLINAIKDICRTQTNLKYVGEVNGIEKAELIANAKALILPTQLPDACPTTVSEALISGTPVIGSVNGSLPEIVPPEVGFVCKTEVDYVKAIFNINKVSTQACRDFAMKNYSSVVCAEKHITFYENMIRCGAVC